MSEDIRRQSIYLASVDLLRRLLRDQKFEKAFIDQLNRKNAETLGCKVVDL